jgi:hypothetical protein
MTFIIETKLPDYEDWYPVIDVDNSTVVPKPKYFYTEEQAKAWAEKYVVDTHEWRVTENESE